MLALRKGLETAHWNNGTVTRNLTIAGVIGSNNHFDT